MAEDVPPDDRHVEIVRDRDGRDAATVRIDGTDQSHVDLGDPTRIEFDYVRRIADVVDGLGEPGAPLRCVHVGGAGMTLARYVAHTRPRSRQVVLEPDADLTALVRAELPLPPRSGISVRPVDGRTGVAELRDESFDVVIVDAFAGAQVPAELVTTEWFADVARVVGQGVVLVNLADKAPFDHARRAVAAVRATLPHVVVSAEPATLRGRRFGNLLVLASHGALDVGPLVRRAASSPFPYRILERDELSDRLGGGAPFTDADTRPSPQPPRGAHAFS